jgi:FMN phosphatase YigB (HAD superfamily)
MIEAVFFDLYETLITELDPDWHPGKETPTAELLGIERAVFDAEWQARRLRRMTSALDFPSVVRDICAAAGKAAGEIDEQVVADLHARRSRAKALRGMKLWGFAQWSSLDEAPASIAAALCPTARGRGW